MEIAIKIAGKVESSFKTSMSFAKNSLKSVTKATTAATKTSAVALAAISASAVKVGSDFEKSMSQVAATMLIDKSTQKGKKDFEILEEAARECGATTAFSAQEAAKGLNYLALAGYDAQKAANALPTVLKVAGAGAMELGAASDMLTDAMSALGIEATSENLNKFADEMAMTASKANTSVSQLGEAVLTVGGTAKGLAGGTTELNSALGILANNGIKGAEGGTLLRNVILSLQSPTDKAAKALEKIGVSAYDSSGNMRDMQVIFQDMNKGLEGMTSQEQDNIITTIFNKTDLKGARALISDCGDSWEALEQNIRNCSGACEEMYAIQMDNLSGDIDNLSSALEDVGISIYKDMNSPLRDTVQMATDMVSQLGNVYKDGGFNAMVEELGTCFAEILNITAQNAPEVVEIAVKMVDNFVEGISSSADKLGQYGSKVVSSLISGYVKMIPQVMLAGVDLITSLAEGLIAEAPQIINSGAETISEFIIGVAQRIQQIGTIANSLINVMVNAILTNLPKIITSGITLIESLAKGMLSQAPIIIKSAINIVLALAQGIIAMLPSILQLGLSIVVGLVQGIMENLPQILSMAVELVLTLINGIVQMVPMIVDAGAQLLQNILIGLVQNIPRIVQAAFQIVGALINGLFQMIPTLFTTVPKLTSTIVEVIFSTDWIEVGKQIIIAIKDGIINTAKSLASGVKDAVVSLFSGGKDKAKEEGESTGSAFTNGVSKGCSSFGSATSGLTFDTTMINAQMATAGETAGTTFASGLNTGVASARLDTSTLAIDTTLLNAQMATAGETAGTTFASNVNLASTNTNMTDLTLDTSGITSKVEEANRTTSNKMQEMVTSAKNAVKSIESAFSSMSIKIPRPKLPVIRVAYNAIPYGDGGNVSVPKFNVSWHAVGGVFKKPTLLNSTNGFHGVGEAGKEALLPLDTLWGKMEEILQRNQGGESVIEKLLGKLQGIGDRNNVVGQQRELATEGGINITWNPTYNINGNISKDDVVEANRMSQQEFNRMMKQYEKDNKRKKL